MKPFAFVAVAAVWIALAGCHGSKLGEPTPVPRYPKAVKMPVDPALQASAAREIDSALHSSDEVLRGEAIETLKSSRLSGADEKILHALDDPSIFVRESAAMAAGERKIQAAAPRLLELMDGQMGSTPQDALNADQERLSAIFALHCLGNTKFSNELVKTAFDTRVKIRCHTAFLFGLLGEKSAIPTLVKMLRNDNDISVRLQAGEALWRLGNEEGENALLAATISSVGSDQIMAAIGLAEPRDTALLGHIEGMFGNDHLEVNLACARAAGMLGSDRGYGYAIQGSESSDPRQRGMAALAFGDIPRTDSQPRLAKLLKDSNANVRLAAAKALVEIGEGQ